MSDSKRRGREDSGSADPRTAKRVKVLSERVFKSKYSWKELHADMEKRNYAGTYGGANAAFHGLAGVRAGVNMAKFHSKRSPDEFYIPELEKLLHNPEIQKHWGGITTFDPLGMFATRPTMSATSACMTIPEIQGNLVPDKHGVVNEDRTINVIKCAVDYVWNVPRLAEAINMDEQKMRVALAESTGNPSVNEGKQNAYLPPLAGLTVYFIGDINRLNDPKTEVAVRVHDSCCGSDVMGTDICTCRPYLMFAVQAAVECAQRGGVGIIAYFQKEGRSLGEVTKFRVYNARKRQEGGDRPEKYFYQTESIAGIRDARFQEMMPDVLLWLGIRRIDWLLSMSNEKYDAITGAGIQVLQRVPLPDMLVPKGAGVEISAKIASGYHTKKVDSANVLTYLRQLTSIRERCQEVFDLAKEGKSPYFEYHPEKLQGCIDEVLAEIKNNYPGGVDTIPFHSRWRHFEMKDVESMTESWPDDKYEKARRMIDLAFVSVLLDAGAGHQWKFIDSRSNTVVRSEGLAIASFQMFSDGLFSSDPVVPHRVNSHGLKHLKMRDFERGFQVSDHNPMKGVKDRFHLLQRLGQALDGHPEFFGKEVARPGNVVDYLLKNTNKRGEVDVRVLWRAVIEGLESIWPETISGVRRGDVWAYSPLQKIGVPGSDMVPFHKLSQWLTYSLLEPLSEVGIKVTNTNLMTGLAEYRNGGLLVDSGVLSVRSPVKFAVDTGSEFVVEWRALTVILLDLIAEGVRKSLKRSDLQLVQVLQGGTWSAGRRLAKNARPDTGCPPIVIRSNGTVF